MGCTQGPACSSCCQVFAFLGFLASAMWINAAATELVNILRTLGIIFQLSNTVLGLTLLAWGNSIGGEGSAGPQCPPGTPWGPPAIPKVSLSPSTDTFSDLTMARQGYPRMAFSACFGGIIFSILWMPGPGWWHGGRELPEFPCLQRRESPGCCRIPGEEWGRIHPRVPPALGPRSARGQGGVWERQGQSQQHPPVPTAAPAPAGWEFGLDYGTFGIWGLCLPPVGFAWSPEQAEASPRVLEVVFTTGRECLSQEEEEEDVGQSHVLSAAALPSSPVPCVSILNVLQTSWWAWGWAACCR